MKKGQSIETISLEEALDLFKLPRTLGDFEDKTVVIGTGRFGPYVRHNAKFISLPKGADPMEVTLEEAIELIEAKRIAEAQKIIKTFDEEPELQILNGRFGPYIAYKGTNYKIPKDVVPQDLNLATCFEIVRIQDEKPATPKRGRYAKKK
jgi:DNA topoisomerase-1